ncbi:MAG: NAD(P)H-dependent oxidoreductase subunit E, partial [Gemmatimonadetes bacterium]|nr:NAD(P)H-dependent oxidoreductase subunit E [Gemmatimonadota bacterium]
MASPSNHDLIERWRGEPAPLLPLLHAFHDRDGYLSEESIRATADALHIPLADLYGTVTFYHHFSRQEPGEDAPPGRGAPRVCTGPICRLVGAHELLAAM